MGIPESQLNTWSRQGSITQSSATYKAIKDALENAWAPYANKSFRVFLQGSYGNDTNIYAESDVDVVIVLDTCFYHDLEALPLDQKSAFESAYPGAAEYGVFDFKQDVLAHLTGKYGDAVTLGDKAIRIDANGGRRKADVIVAAEYRRYYRFLSLADTSFSAGICFFNANGTRIANYSQQHLANCTTKHQATNDYFKPTVRIFKNVRSRLVETGMIEDGTAPSYFIEGLLYNVPAEHFRNNYADTFVSSVNWLLSADREKFLCANEQYHLLNPASPVTWRAAQCSAFLVAAAKLWNEW